MVDKLAKIYETSIIVAMAVVFFILFYLFFIKTGMGSLIAAFLKKLLIQQVTKPEPGSWGTDIRINFMNLDHEINHSSKCLWNKLKIKPEHVRELKLFLLISGIAIGSRLILYGIGYLGAVTYFNLKGSFFETFEEIWKQWDSGMYTFIAENWYVTVTDKKYLIVFFPLYPVLMKLFHLVLKNYFISGIVLSNLSLCFSAFYLYKLVRLDFNKYVSFNAVKFLLIFPFSFFLGACFSDGLFLTLSIMTFYYIRKKNWLATGLCGLLATLTRNFGLLLIIPAVIEYVIHNQSIFKPANFWRIAKHGIYLLFIPLGYGIYLLINKLVTGEWFTFMRYQEEYWYHRMAFFPDLAVYFHNALGMAWSMEDRIAIWIPQVTLIALVSFLIFYAIKKIRYSYIVYMFIYLFLCLSMTWLLSGARYILGIFPIYLLLALLSRNRYVNAGITFVTYLLLGFYTVAYVGGYRIM